MCEKQSEIKSLRYVLACFILAIFVFVTGSTIVSAGDFIPSYSGTPYVDLNNGIPMFTPAEKKLTHAFETYSKLDSLKRCGVAYANICKELMPTKPRGDIGSVKPSGWHTVKYSDLIDDLFLYNRCHLIGYQLAGENANVKNLITGTRYLNVTGMLPFEEKVANYVKKTGNHVLYRVTPKFTGSNLVADGVQMEAFSVEDGGKGICFNVFCYNVQPGITINYATGDSARSGKTAQNQSAPAVKAPAVTESAPVVKTPAVTETAPAVKTPATSATGNYIANRSTMKFHYPSCSGVKDMLERNKLPFSGSRDELIAMGYVPCKRCNP